MAASSDEPSSPCSMTMLSRVGQLKGISRKASPSYTFRLFPFMTKILHPKIKFLSQTLEKIIKSYLTHSSQKKQPTKRTNRLHYICQPEPCTRKVVPLYKDKEKQYSFRPFHPLPLPTHRHTHKGEPLK